MCQLWSAALLGWACTFISRVCVQWDIHVVVVVVKGKMHVCGAFLMVVFSPPLTPFFALFFINVTGACFPHCVETPC